MTTSIWRRIGITALVGCTVAALAAPAWGQGNDLRRDGSKAAPFVADVGAHPGASPNALGLRRDGSKAAPFVADLEPGSAAAADGFDWRDAAIGAGFGAAAVLFAMTGTSALRGRRRGVPQAIGTGSRAASG